MGKLLSVVLFLFSFNIQAVDCTFTWDASVSENVIHYNLYNGDAILVPDIKELTTTIDCVAGVFALTAVNKFGLESEEKSNSIIIKKPDSPLGFDVIIPPRN